MLMGVDQKKDNENTEEEKWPVYKIQIKVC